MGLGHFFVLKCSPGFLQLANAVENFHPLIVLNRVLGEGSKNSDSIREILKANFCESIHVDFGINDLPPEERIFSPFMRIPTFTSSLFIYS